MATQRAIANENRDTVKRTFLQSYYQMKREVDGISEATAEHDQGRRRYFATHSFMPTPYEPISHLLSKGHGDETLSPSSLVSFRGFCHCCGFLGIYLVLFAENHSDSPYFPTSRAYGYLLQEDVYSGDGALMAEQFPAS